LIHLIGNDPFLIFGIKKHILRLRHLWVVRFDAALDPDITVAARFSECSVTFFIDKRPICADSGRILIDAFPEIK
jgi:hypothetical protein